MIKSLSLTNFKQHRQLTVLFQNGLNSVQGENGAGKTTILRGILFALFGAQAAGAKGHLTTWGESKMSVSMLIAFPEVGDVAITRSNTKAEIRKEGQLLASGQSSVTEYVQDKLGMDAKLFKTLLYAGQDETQLLLKMGAAGLQKQLEGVAKLDVLDRVLAMIAADNHRAEGELAGIGELPDINAMRNTRDGLAKELEAFEQKSTTAKKELDDAEIFLKLAKETHAKLSKEFNDAITVRQQHQLARAASEVAKKELQDLRDKAVTPVSQEWVDQLRDQVTSAEQALREKTQMWHEAQLAAKRYEDLRSHVADLSKLLPHWEQLQTLFEQEQERKQQHLDLQQQLKQAKDALTHAVCHACHRPFDEKTLQEAEASVEALTDRVNQAHSVLQKASAEFTTYLASIGRSFNEVKTAVDSYASFSKILESTPVPEMPTFTQQDLETETAALRKMQEELQRAMVEYRTYNQHLLDLKKREDAVQQTMAQVVELEKHLGTLSDVSETAVQDAYQAIDKYSEATKTLHESWSTAVLHTSKHAAQVEELTRQLDKLAENMDRVNSIRRDIELRTDLSKYLRKNRASFMQDTWQALTQYTSHLISTTTDGLISDLYRANNGDFYVTEAGQQAPVEELSGARKSIVGLCLRLGLLHLFYGDSGFLLLDEVTANCSEANSARVAGLLRSLKSQVIMVTHRQSDAVNAHHSIVLA